MHCCILIPLRCPFQHTALGYTTVIFIIWKLENSFYNWKIIVLLKSFNLLCLQRCIHPGNFHSSSVFFSRLIRLQLMSYFPFIVKGHRNQDARDPSPPPKPQQQQTDLGFLRSKSQVKLLWNNQDWYIEDSPRKNIIRQHQFSTFSDRTYNCIVLIYDCLHVLNWNKLLRIWAA